MGVDGIARLILAPLLPRIFCPRVALQLLECFLCPELGSEMGHCGWRGTSPGRRLVGAGAIQLPPRQSLCPGWGAALRSVGVFQREAVLGAVRSWAQYSTSLNLTSLSSPLPCI